MDFKIDDFGIQDTQLVEGTPMLFSDEEPKPIDAPENKDPEKEGEEGFKLDDKGPLLFQEDESEDKSKPEVSTPVPDKTPEPSDTPDEDTTYSAIYKTLLEQNILSLDEEGEEEEIKTPEQLLEKFQVEAEKRANDLLGNFLGKFGQDKVDFFNAVFVNGVDPQEYFKVEQKVESVRNIDLESVENQEQVISQYYKNIGWSNERIKKHLKRLEEDGETDTEARDLHSQLLQKEQLEQQNLIQQQTLAAQQKAQEEQYYVHNINNIIQQKLKSKDFDGIPVTEKVARATADSLTTKKWKLASGETLTDFDRWVMELKNPENYELRVKIDLLRQTGFDFSKIKTKAITETNNKLFEGLQRKEKQESRTKQTHTGFSI